MIDIHSHILPGLDDGSGSLEESLQLARAAVNEGIHTIIATPHHANGRYLNEAVQVYEAVQRFQEAITAAEIPLRIEAGQEIRVYGEFLNDLRSGKLVPLANSRYILLEFPTSKVPSTIHDTIHELVILGLIPILAHPERNMELAKHPEKLVELIDSGMLSQITSHSVNGLFGKKIQETSINFVKWNLVHFIASDAHNMSDRAFGLRKSYEHLEHRLDSFNKSYFIQNAEHLLNNEPILPMSTKLDKKMRFLFWK